jgi:hypothetical protein
MLRLGSDEILNTDAQCDKDDKDTFPVGFAPDEV